MSATAMTDCSFLGREFTTWLWFLCEVEGGDFELPSGLISLVFEDNLVLVGHDDDDSATQVKGGCPTLRPEAASALAAGMTVRRARIHAARDEREWTFNLDSETLDLRSVKVPGSEAEDPLEQLSERLESAEELRIAIEELYSRFIQLRLSPQWDGLEAERMRDWVKTKLDRANSDQDRFSTLSHTAPSTFLDEGDVAKPVEAPKVVAEEFSENLDSEDLDDDDDD